MSGLRKAVLTERLTLAWLIASTLVLGAAGVDAQSLRDPTVPPLEALPPSTAQGQVAVPPELGVKAIIVRDGQRYLVVGTRLYATGQPLGHARIERITETEVWLREGGVLRKVSQFPGIERRSVAACPDIEASGAPGRKVAKASSATGSFLAPSGLIPCIGVSPRGSAQ